MLFIVALLFVTNTLYSNACVFFILLMCSKVLHVDCRTTWRTKWGSGWCGRQWLVWEAVAGGQGGGWPVWHLCADKSQGTGEWGRLLKPAWRNKASKPLTVKTGGGWGSGRNSQPHRKVRWRDPQECTQTHPPRNQHQKDPICLWVAGEVTDSQSRAEQVALFLLGPLPHIQYHNLATWVALPWQIPKALTLTMQQVHGDKKKIWPKWKNWSKLHK